MLDNFGLFKRGYTRGERGASLLLDDNSLILKCSPPCTSGHLGRETSGLFLAPLLRVGFMTEGQVILSVIQPLQFFTICYRRLSFECKNEIYALYVCKRICDVEIKWRQCIKVYGSIMISLSSVLQILNLTLGTCINIQQ